MTFNTVLGLTSTSTTTTTTTTTTTYSPPSTTTYASTSFHATIVPTKSDSHVIFCLQLLSI